MFRLVIVLVFVLTMFLTRSDWALSISFNWAPTNDKSDLVEAIDRDVNADGIDCSSIPNWIDLAILAKLRVGSRTDGGAVGQQTNSPSRVRFIK